MAPGKTVNSEEGGASGQPGFMFVALLVVAVLISTTTIIEPAYSHAQSFTVFLTSLVGDALGLSISSHGNVLTVNGFAMTIIGECTALNYITVLALALLMYSRHPLWYRLAGCLAATVVIVFANSIRLILTGLAGTVSMPLFHFLHEYIWVAAFALMVFGLWKVWVDQKLQYSGAKAVNAMLAAAGCTGMFALLVAFRDEYYQLLVLIASPLFKLLMYNSDATITWSGVLVCMNEDTVFRTGMMMGGHQHFRVRRAYVPGGI